MDIEPFAQGLLILLLIWSVGGALFATIGSYGLYKLLAAKQNPSAKAIAIVAFVLTLALGVGGIFFGQFNVAVAVLMFAYFIFGLTTWVTNR
jgi:hypothetical protein